MEIEEIVDRASLEKWFADKPYDWAPGLTFRAALRALPAINSTETEIWLGLEAIRILRALTIVYVVNEKIAPINADAAVDFARVRLSDFLPGLFEGPARVATEGAIHGRLRSSSMSVSAVGQACSSFPYDWRNFSWEQIRLDCQLVQVGDPYDSASRLTKVPLWTNGIPVDWSSTWESMSDRLRAIDSNFQTLIEWFENRLAGKPFAFEIPGDIARSNEKMIFFRLIDADHLNFWGKGHEFVNSELTRWLEEARARAAGSQSDDTSTTPPQDPSATTYGVNAQGQLDRLPPANQVHLRDVPNQRRSYADLRAAVMELLQEGQRLGPRLQPRLERFGQSLPEDFERAEAYLVWRDGIALRRLYRAHLAVAKGKDPDPALLDPAAAEGLGEVLDLYNPFAFADDGIRAKDEATIAPQERADAEAEAAAAAPLVSAIMAAPEIATAAALGDISADAEDADLPGDDPYAAQVLDQANRTRGNLIIALVNDTWSAFKDTEGIGKAIAGSAAWDGIKLVGTLVGGIDFAALLEFIAINATTLQSYVAVAFTSFPHLPHVIDQISALWNRIRNQ